MTLRTALVLALLPLAACRTESTTEPTPEAAPPAVGDVAGPEAAPSVVAAPDEVVRVEAAQIGLALVEGEQDSYDLNIVEGLLEMGERIPADSAATQRWLSRFSPLGADGTYGDLDPAGVQNEYTASVTFVFSDDSARTLFFQTQPDGVAVVSQPDGPVWRVSPEAYRSLVPLAADLRAN